MDSYLFPPGTSTKLRPTGLHSLAGHINGHDSAPLPAMDTAWLHHSLACHSNGHDSTPLPAMDFVRLLHSLASHDNGCRSTPRNRLHVAGHGNGHDFTPLLFITNSFWHRAAHCQTVTNVAISLLHPPPIKGGPQIRYFLSSDFYLKTLLKFLFEHSILIEAEN